MSGSSGASTSRRTSTGIGGRGARPACSAASSGRDACRQTCGGALVGSCLRDGLLDELRLHVAGEVLGAGTPLFAGAGRHRLVRTAVEVSPVCTHLTVRVAH